MSSTVVGNSLPMAASSVGGAPTENKQEKKSNDRHLKYRRLAACGCNFMAGVLLKGLCRRAAAAAAMVGGWCHRFCFCV